MEAQDAAELTALEESLWRPATRFDRAHLERVPEEHFDELGRSGRYWSRGAAIAADAEPFEPELPLPGLRVWSLGPDAPLPTHPGVITRPADGLVPVANRSSVRRRIDGRRRLRFHQVAAAAD